MKKTKNPSPVWLVVLIAVVFCSTSNFLPRCEAAAASSIDALTTTTQLLSAAAAGGGGGAGMADDDDDEFLMESGSSSQSMRMLQGGSNNVYQSINRGSPAFNCGRAQYNCLGNGRDRKLYCDPRSRDPRCRR